MFNFSAIHLLHDPQGILQSHHVKRSGCDVTHNIVIRRCCIQVLPKRCSNVSSRWQNDLRSRSWLLTSLRDWLAFISLFSSTSTRSSPDSCSLTSEVHHIVQLHFTNKEYRCTFTESCFVEVTRILTYAAQSAHDLVPPEVHLLSFVVLTTERSNDVTVFCCCYCRVVCGRSLNRCS